MAGEGKGWEVSRERTVKVALEVLFGVFTLSEKGLVVTVTRRFAGM